MAIGIYEEKGELEPAGVAFHAGYDERGQPQWAIEIDGVRVPGKFVINDDHFDLVQSDSDCFEQAR